MKRSTPSCRTHKVFFFRVHMLMSNPVGYIKLYSDTRTIKDDPLLTDMYWETVDDEYPTRDLFAKLLEQVRNDRSLRDSICLLELEWLEKTSHCDIIREVMINVDEKEVVLKRTGSSDEAIVREIKKNFRTVDTLSMLTTIDKYDPSGELYTLKCKRKKI